MPSKKRNSKEVKKNEKVSEKKEGKSLEEKKEKQVEDKGNKEQIEKKEKNEENLKEEDLENEPENVFFSDNSFIMGFENRTKPKIPSLDFDDSLIQSSSLEDSVFFVSSTTSTNENKESLGNYSSINRSYSQTNTYTTNKSYERANKDYETPTIQNFIIDERREERFRPLIPIINIPEERKAEVQERVVRRSDYPQERNDFSLFIQEQKDKYSLKEEEERKKRQRKLF